MDIIYRVYKTAQQICSEFTIDAHKIFYTSTKRFCEHSQGSMHKGSKTIYF